MSSSHHIPQSQVIKSLGAEVMTVDDPTSDRSELEWPSTALVPSRSSPILSWADICVTDYITHCTRQQTGPWPDQSEEDYLDDLILGRPGSNHSPLAVLRRIVDQQRLIATGRTIRGGTKVVCFTAVALNEIAELRTYRRHRGRWDFEPYGISIARRWLEQSGARPVHYGDLSLWDQLPDSERPYYQARFSGKRGQIDWSVEREWRHIGDVDLEPFPADAALLFVHHREEAEWLSAFSRWPVMVVE